MRLLDTICSLFFLVLVTLLILLASLIEQSIRGSAERGAVQNVDFIFASLVLFLLVGPLFLIVRYLVVMKVS